VRIDEVAGIADDPLFSALTPAFIALGLYLIGVALWPRPTATSRALLLSMSVAFMAQYTWWRVRETLPPPAFSLEFTVGVGFLVTETAGATAALSILFLLRARDRSDDVDANAEWLASVAKYPSVDVLICSYNEERSILERTIVGALAMDYPNFRVWVLGDTRRDWLKILCARLGCRYVSRPDNKHAKASNINHALKLIASLPDRPEFISILDADFVPRQDFWSGR
jgi:cellulose synthase (UDP-forming)